MHNSNGKRETFAISDHTATTYAAAEVLGSDDHEKVAYLGKRGWFVPRWQAISIGVIIFVMLFVAAHIGRTINTNKHVEHHKHTETIRTHVTSSANALGSVSGIDPSISEVDQVEPAVISAHTNITAKDLTAKMRYLIEPINYRIFIKPFLETPSNFTHSSFTFSGNVSISLHVKEEVKYIVIGVNDLRIVSTNLYEIHEERIDDNVRRTTIVDTIDLSIDSYDVNEGTLNLELYKWLQPGKIYGLSIEFNGAVQNLPYGLFKSQTQDKVTGENRWLVGTNLDIPFARTVFPCFDAPTQLATFQLNIARRENMLVQSSTPYGRTIETGDGWIWIEHLKTQPIPVHSLSFVVNNFECEIRVTPQVAHFNIWTATKHTKELEYVTNVGPLLIKDIELYLGVALPVKKINIYGLPQVLPRQTAKIGMIYMSEADLIVQEGKTCTKHRQYVAQTLAGHLVEQWIENLIMFQWRHDNWIKEALVQYFEYFMLKYVEPKWNTIDQFFVDVHQLEMDKEIADPNRQGRYIRWVPYVDESKIQYLYPLNDTDVFRRSETAEFRSRRLITETQAKPFIYTQLYEKRLIDKGACLIRMIKHIVSEPVFVAALREFLEDSRGKVVNGEDLWATMTKGTLKTKYPGYVLLPDGVSLQVVLEDWIYTEGYPLVTVVRNYNNNTITFSQHNKTSMDPHTGNTRRLNLWYIPVSYTTESEKFFTATAPRFWLNKVKSVDIVTPSELRNSNWILVNPQQTNFYRVFYDYDNWRLLRRALHNGELPEIVRSQLIDDALFFGRKGMLSYDFALDFISYFADYKEKDYIVWRTLLRHMNDIRYILLENETTPEKQGTINNADMEESQHFQKFKVFMKSLITPPFNDLNSKWAESQKLEHTDRLLRSDIFLWACAMGMSECNTIARAEFDKWLKSRNSENPIEPDMRYAILCSVMQIGGTSDYDFLLNQYKNTPDTSPDKYTYLKSLYCFKREKHYKEFLSSTLDDDYSVDHLHKVSMMWSAIPQSFHTSTVPFKFMIDNWKKIKSRFADYKTIMTTIVEAATFNLQKKSELISLNELVDDDIDELPYLQHTFDDAIRNLRDRKKWKEERMSDFLSWIQKRSVDEDTSDETTDGLRINILHAAEIIPTF